MPYEVARKVSLTKADLRQMRPAGGAAAWVADGAEAWLKFWYDEVGRAGFYPFDLLAAAYAMRPGMFDCAHALAWVGKDRKLWNIIYDPDALLVGLASEVPVKAAARDVIYCVDAGANLEAWLMSSLAGSPR